MGSTNTLETFAISLFFLALKHWIITPLTAIARAKTKTFASPEDLALSKGEGQLSEVKRGNQTNEQKQEKRRKNERDRERTKERFDREIEK